LEENGKAKERTGGKFAQLDWRRMVMPKKELEAPEFTGAVVFNWIDLGFQAPAKSFAPRAIYSGLIRWPRP
jgi:hypothetical protein